MRRVFAFVDCGGYPRSIAGGRKRKKGRTPGRKSRSKSGNKSKREIPGKFAQEVSKQQQHQAAAPEGADEGANKGAAKQGARAAPKTPSAPQKSTAEADQENRMQSQIDALNSEIALLQQSLTLGSVSLAICAVVLKMWSEGEQEEKATLEDSFPVQEEVVEYPEITEDGELNSVELSQLQQHPDILVNC